MFIVLGIDVSLWLVPSLSSPHILGLPVLVRGLSNRYLAFGAIFAVFVLRFPELASLLYRLVETIATVATLATAWMGLGSVFRTATVWRW
jgi:hypothetical protein